MDSPLTPASRRRALATVLVIGLSWLIALAVLLLRGDVDVSAAQLDAVAAAIRTDAPEGVLLVHPPWRDDLTRELRQRLPDRDIRLSPPVREGAPSGTLVVLRAGSTPGPASLWGQAGHALGRFGGLELWRYQLGSARVATSGEGASLLLNRVKDLRVRIDFADHSLDCNDYQPAGPQYNCPGLNEWNHVGTTTLRIDGRERRCLWAHPITDGTLVISRPWPEGVRRLRFFYGLADTAAAAAGGQSVVLRIKADDQLLQTLTQRNQRGYNRVEFNLPSDLNPARLQIEIRTTNDGARHLCIDAVAMDKEP